MTSLFRCSTLSARLVPDPDSEDEAYIVNAHDFSAKEICGLTKLAGVRYTDVRREFTAELVTQAQTGIEL